MMKLFFSTLCMILLTLGISACSTNASPLAPIAGEESMKGYELYSWQQDGQWYFSVLIGTNREKNLEEIQASDVTLQGIDELQGVLESIPAGQYVTWLLPDGLAFPPDETIQEVEDACKAQGLNFSIAR
jgi:hypothetical protein